jgi:outer membrane protein
LKTLLKPLVAIFSFCFFATQLSAQTIAVIDMVKISQELQLESKIRKKVDVKFADRLASFEKSRIEFQKISEDLQRNQTTFSDSKKKEMTRDLETRKVILQQQGSALEQDTKMAFMQAQKKILKQVEEVVAQVAKDKKYDLVIQRRNAVYSNQTSDISDAIVKRLSTKKIAM